MRVLICSLLLGVLVLSCNDKVKAPTETSYESAKRSVSGDTTMPLESIDTATALQMIRHFKDSSVAHSKLFWGSFKFNPAYAGDPDRSIKVFAAAYLPTDKDSARRNMPTMILQLGYKKAGDKYVTYSYYAPLVCPLCPPPPECLTLIETPEL